MIKYQMQLLVLTHQRHGEPNSHKLTRCFVPLHSCSPSVLPCQYIPNRNRLMTRLNRVKWLTRISAGFLLNRGKCITFSILLNIPLVKAALCQAIKFPIDHFTYSQGKISDMENDSCFSYRRMHHFVFS